jgi:hypothetical protein
MTATGEFHAEPEATMQDFSARMYEITQGK